jgi:AraC family transcriptional regulator, transcriptional activator of pobA
MNERIPTHQLTPEQQYIPALKIFQFKNSHQIENQSSLPITPLPTDAPHRHSYYEILFIEEGQGYHEIDFETFPIQGAGLHFLMPGQVHLLHFQSRCQGYIVAFSEDFFSFYNPESPGLAHFPFFRSAHRQPVLRLEEREQRYFHNLLENMAADFLLSPSDLQLTGKSLGILMQKSVLLAQENELERVAASYSVPELVLDFQEMADRLYRQQHAVQYYAQQLDISPDYLSKSVKKHLGQSAGEYLLTKVLLEAKRLLVFTSMSSKEIAYTLHMEDPSYFGRIFKRKTGLTPSEYRASVRKSAII